MLVRLTEAGLWSGHTDKPEIDITLAWSILARLGLPARYGGRALDGSYEYVITDPGTGDFIATGRGRTLARSMCEAALNACARIDSS